MTFSDTFNRFLGIFTPKAVAFSPAIIPTELLNPNVDPAPEDLTIQVTQELFNEVFTDTTVQNTMYPPLNALLTKYSINSAARIAMFLAQTYEETAGWTELVENLNYSAAALVATWPSHFDATTSILYARQPEKIANRAYADRMGNGNEASGDGWEFRGRGIIQLTGRTNYQNFANFMGKSITDTVTYMSTPAGAIEVGCYFWQINQLNKYADDKDVAGATQTINGGLTGLSTRENLYTQISSDLNAG